MADGAPTALDGSYKSRLCAIVVVVCGVLSGCVASRRTHWRPPLTVAPANETVTTAGSDVEAAYRRAFLLESCGDPRCVDAYLNAATLAWPGAVEAFADHTALQDRSNAVYHAAVARLLLTAQRFGRWRVGQTPALKPPSEDGGARRRLVTGGRLGTTMPAGARFYGFVWKPEDFGILAPVGDYASPAIRESFGTAGIGTPLVVVRTNSRQIPFVRGDMPFAATAIVRPGPTEHGPGARLEFYDPLRVQRIAVAGCPLPLASDITAPFAYPGRDDGQRAWDYFLRPGATGSRDGLFMIEPYQPGKIPVIFVHGLLSEPRTWADVANQLRAWSGFTDHYQIWAFRYATGEPFLGSAAILRRQLREIRECYDPERRDPALSRMILIGHSMGGLVAKLQATYSGDRLWSAAARVPLHRICTSASTRTELADSFFFDPNPDVARIIFVGTPHRGSSWARRSLGRLGSALVQTDPSRKAIHEQLIRDNPGVFSDELRRRVPTSIDLLEPDSRLLQATADLPFYRGTARHSIVGDGRYTVGSGRSDGVVPVSSASLPGVLSEMRIPTTHTELHRSAEAVLEIQQILQLHLQSLPSVPAEGEQVRQAPSRNSCDSWPDLPL